MVNYSPTDASAFNVGGHNGTGTHNYSDHDYYNYYYSSYIFPIFGVLICISGILGNGMVIWLLGFRIKRNPFTTYILSLAIADFGFLTTVLLTLIMSFLTQIFTNLQMDVILFFLFDLILLSMFSTSQFLLTVISMDRCVSVFFPLWHRCRRPTYLSTIVCALIRVLFFLLPATIFIFDMVKKWMLHYAYFQLMLNTCFCLPLMTISSLTLFMKICCKSKQQRKGKLLVTILITIFFFLLFSFPLNTLYFIHLLFHIKFHYTPFAICCACLNSSVNPLIYYLIGRPKKGRSNKSMKAALQKLFKEEEI